MMQEEQQVKSLYLQDIVELHPDDANSIGLSQGKFEVRIRENKVLAIQIPSTGFSICTYVELAILTVSGKYNIPINRIEWVEIFQQNKNYGKYYSTFDRVSFAYKPKLLHWLLEWFKSHYKSYISCKENQYCLAYNCRSKDAFHNVSWHAMTHQQLEDFFGVPLPDLRSSRASNYCGLDSKNGI